MLPSETMSGKKHWLLAGCCLRESSQWRNTNYWSNITLGKYISKETLTTGRMLPSRIMSVKKHWLSVGWYPREPCQWRNTDYWSAVTLMNHVSDETLTTGRMLPSGIMPVKKHWQPVGCYPREPCQWRNTDYWSDVNLGNHCQWRNSDYWSDVTLGNHVSEETVTTGQILPSGIRSVKYTQLNNKFKRFKWSWLLLCQKQEYLHSNVMHVSGKNFLKECNKKKSP